MGNCLNSIVALAQSMRDTVTADQLLGRWRFMNATRSNRKRVADAIRIPVKVWLR